MRELIYWVIVGVVAGWLTGKIMKGAGFGPVMDLVVGTAGAILGGLLLQTLGFGAPMTFIGRIVVSVLGAVLLVWIVRKIKG